MRLLQKLLGLFSRTRHLGQVSHDHLRKERLRLEQIEHRISSEIEKLEQAKHDLFEQGRGQNNQRQQRILARRIQAVDAEARAKDQQLARVAQQMRIVSGLMVIKENEELARELGVSGIVSRLDIETLEKYVDRAHVDGQFQMERFAQMIRTLDSAGEYAAEPEEDEQTLAIVQAMQDARDPVEPGAEGTPDEAARAGDGMEKVNRILHRGGEDEDQGKATEARP